ncbi:hypothetical protein DBB42_01060 [Pseudomonas plecoglossicida]|uniref:Uncharacterized protein n=1 Tax=Pseudomonas plecoglossicida TaxID=70775 RepID=A0A2R7UU28_PSEDL|nr:hypothetical protein DBB42_01060 [Pseudomonas plecoglossicida]
MGAGRTIAGSDWAFLHWPFRGLARSHRISNRLKACAVPVGAGEPAKRPVQDCSYFPRALL